MNTIVKLQLLKAGIFLIELLKNKGKLYPVTGKHECGREVASVVVEARCYGFKREVWPVMR